MANLIINIRGTSGSGKTTVAREFMRRFDHLNLEGSDGKVRGVRVDVPMFNHPLYLIGKYDNACGGMDSITTQEEAAQRVVKAFKAGGHVICEGLLASSVGPNATFPRIIYEGSGGRVKFVTLDTPLETCLERVQARRNERGDQRPFNPKNTIDKYNQVRRAYELMEEGGRDIRWIDHKDPFTAVYNLFAEAENE